MSNFIIDVPMPAMGATVSELTIVNLAVAPGTPVAKGQKLAELESDKSAFDFGSPADGIIMAVNGKAGDVMASGQSLFRMETADQSLAHLAVEKAADRGQQTGNTAAVGSPSSALCALIWTPRATKMAQEAGLDLTTVTDITATGPGGRVSGDDVTKYLANRQR